MKICVFSDTHGNGDGIIKMLEKESPNAVIFLGDGIGDVHTEDIRNNIDFWEVRGNCDFFSQLPAYRVCDFDTVKIFITHGYKYGVKSGLQTLCERALDYGCTIALYGHTHIADISHSRGVDLVCPGSLNAISKSYLVLNITDGKASYQHKTL